MRIRRGHQADIPFVMSTERLPGYEELVGRWDDERHLAAMKDGRHAYFIGEDGPEAVGFVIVRDWDSPERAVLIKRIAVAQPGSGSGSHLLARVVDHIFRESSAYRISLGVFPENERARRAYSKIGFRDEGIARGSAYFGGVHRDEAVMAILRPDWNAGPIRPKNG